MKRWKSLETICKNLKNILIGTQYSYAASKGKIFEKYLKKFLTKPKQEITNLYNQPISSSSLI